MAVNLPAKSFETQWTAQLTALLVRYTRKKEVLLPEKTDSAMLLVTGATLLWWVKSEQAKAAVAEGQTSSISLAAYDHGSTSCGPDS